MAQYNLIKKTVLERFVGFVEESDEGCWDWIGSKNSHGYGAMTIDKKSIGAHRVSYRIFNGSLEKGKVIDHICRNRKCVNPDHLRLVSQWTNSIENSNGVSALNAKKTHCVRGHELKTHADYRKFSRQNARVCRACAKITRQKRSEQ